MPVEGRSGVENCQRLRDRLRDSFLPEPEGSPGSAGEFQLGFAGVFAGERGARQSDSVNVFSGVGVPFREREGPFSGLVFIEVEEEDGAVGAAGTQWVVAGVGEADGAWADSNGLLEEFAQKSDFRGAGSVEHATVRPPEDVVRVKVCFTVPTVGALPCGQPEAAGHSVGGDVTPARGDVALVLALVEHNGLGPVGAPSGGHLHARILHAGVSAPDAAVLILITAVVDGAEVIERIPLSNDACVAIPVRAGFTLHQVELVCQRPPDIAESAEARDDISEIAVVNLCGHGLIAPFVIRMKQDEVNLNADAAKVED